MAARVVGCNRRGAHSLTKRLGSRFTSEPKSFVLVSLGLLLPKRGISYAAALLRK